MQDKICKVIDIAFKIVPINKKQVIFYSCLNQYNDNPKYIAEKLHELNPALNFVWATGKLQNNFNMPTYFKQVKHGSLAYFYAKARSAVVVDNGYGIASGYAVGLKRKINMMRKKRNQINVATWHGTPFKRIGADDQHFAELYNNKDFYSMADVLILGSRFESDILQRVTNNAAPVKLFGNPRNDLLFTTDENAKNRLKEKLGFDKNKKVVLFAPTYRENIENAGIRQMAELDIKHICTCLEDKFGGEWTFALRFHQIALQKLQETEGFKFSEMILDGHKSADMSEYLLCCDVLITDFSSTLYDIQHTKKPCFLYAPDYDEYLADRGTYLQAEEFPFSIAKTAQVLYSNISSFDNDRYQKRVEKFQETIGNVNDGNASLRTAEYILNHLKGTKE